MASLLSFAGNALNRIGNTVHNDIVAPVQRDVVAPVQHVVQAAPSYVNNNFVKPLAQFPLDAGNQIYNHAVAPALNLPHLTPAQTTPLRPFVNYSGATGSLHQTIGSGLQTALTIGSGGAYKGLEAGAAKVLPRTLLPRVTANAALGAGFNSASSIAGGANARQTLKAAGTGAAFGAAIPIAGKGIELGSKAGAKTLTNIGIKAPSRLNPSEVTALSKYHQMMGQGAITDDATYRNGIKAANKAKVDPYNAHAISNLLGAHRNYQTQLANRAEQLKTVNQKVGVGNIGLSTKNTGTPLPSSKSPAVDIPSVKLKSGKTNPQQGSGLPQGVKQSKFVGTVKNSPEVSANVQKAVDANYKTGTNAEKVTASTAKVSDNLSTATEQVNNALGKKLGTTTPQEISDAIHVAKAHDAAGNSATATGIYDKIAQHLSAAGQTVQAGALLARRSPEGLRNSAVQTIEKGGKTKVTPELQTQIDSAYKAIKSAPEGSNERAFAVQDLQKIVNNNVSHSKLDKVFTLWRTGLLTGPLTATKVAVSHTLLNTAEKLKDLPAVALDKVISPFSGVRSTALTGRGVLSGANQGMKAATTLLRSGHDTPGTSALGGTYEDLSHPQTAYGNSKLGKAANFYTSKVGQVHAAIPKPFYRSAYENDLFKQADAQGLKGEARDNFVKNPPEINDQEAHLAAQRATFQQPTFLGKSASALQQVPGGRVLVPFARIASAILTDVKDYSPVGAAQSVYDAVKNSKTGWTPQIQKHLVEGIGRGVTGTTVVALGAQLAKNGQITTGYPSDKKEQALWKAEGKQENSVLVNGQWRKTDALGPFGSLLSAGALYQQGKGTNAKGKSNAGEALTGALTDISGQSYLSGLTQAAAAVQNPQENLKSFAKLEAGSVVPVGVGQVATATDKNARTASSPLQAVQSKIPGLREKLPVSQTAFGESITNQNNVLTGLLDPTRPTNVHNDPVTGELQRLVTSTGTSGVPVPSAPTKLSGTGANGASVSVPLNKNQQAQFTSVAGPQIHSELSKVMQSPGYSALSDDSKNQALTTAKTDTENVVKSQLFNQLQSGGQAKLTSNQQSLASGNPVNYVQKAQVTATKAAFQTSNQDFLEKDNNVFQRDTSGNITVTPKVQYDYQVGTATLTQQKNAGDLQGYVTTAQSQLQNIQKQLADPSTSPLKAIQLQNDAFTLQKNIANYSANGLPSSGSSSSKGGSFSLKLPKTTATRIPKLKTSFSAKSPTFKGGRVARLKVPKAPKVTIGKKTIA